MTRTAGGAGDPPRPGRGWPGGEFWYIRPAMAIAASRLLPALLLPLLAAPLGAWVGRWQSWPNLQPTHVLLEHQGRLIVGTDGGIRSIDPATGAEKLYDNRSGLTEIRTVGLAVDPEGRLWAASHSGALFRLEGETWSAWGQSYRSLGWTVNDRAFMAAGSYLVLGSAKGLSFFDRKQKVAVANLTKFGSEGNQRITGLLRRGDTLYLATGTAVLRTLVDWDNALSGRFGTVFDPQIWEKVDSVASPFTLPSFAELYAPTPGDSDGTGELPPPDPGQADPVELAFVDGRVTAHAPGTFLAVPEYSVRALPGRYFAINGILTPDTTLRTALVVGGRLYVGGSGGLQWFSPYADRYPVESPFGFPGGIPGSIVVEGGTVMAQSRFKVWAFRGGRWQERHDLGEPSPELFMNELRNLRVGLGGEMYLGHWGQGVIRQASRGQRRWNAGTDSACLKKVGDPNYTVILGIDIRGKDLWIANLETVGKSETFILAHVDLETGDLSCPDFKGVGAWASTVRILGPDMLGVAGEKGIHLYRWTKRDGKVAGSLLNEFRNDSRTWGRDVAYDSHGRLWGLFSEHLGYVDSLEERLKGGPMTVKFPPNLKLHTCRDMETDARQDLWIGCENGLFHLRPGTDPEAPEVTHYTQGNGLLVNRIFDISVDKASGHVWVATEGGVSRLEGPSPAPVSGVSGVRAYPNPFLAKHTLLVLDQLPGGAEAAILTQGGGVVRSFRRAEMRGNQYHWDGTNAAGRKVKPGIYLYRVTAGGKTSHGKVIVAR